MKLNYKEIINPVLDYTYLVGGLFDGLVVVVVVGDEVVVVG